MRPEIKVAVQESERGLICAFDLATAERLGEEALTDTRALHFIDRDPHLPADATCSFSVIAATMLPVTLITGVFGMNVGGLPWLSDPNGFRWVAAIMVLSVLAALLLLRRRRIF